MPPWLRRARLNAAMVQKRCLFDARHRRSARGLWCPSRTPAALPLRSQAKRKMWI